MATSCDEVVRAMQADGLEWNEDYRPFARAALTEVIEDQMALAVDRLRRSGASSASSPSRSMAYP
jgi:hypothetical protein